MSNPEGTIDNQTRLELEAAAFRRLIIHLDERRDVQNIDLMNLAGFCRNCLSKWYRAEAEERGQHSKKASLGIQWCDPIDRRCCPIGRFGCCARQ